MAEVEVAGAMVNGNGDGVVVDLHLNGGAGGSDATATSTGNVNGDDQQQQQQQQASSYAPPQPLPKYEDLFPALPGGLGAGAGGSATISNMVGPAYGGALSSAAARFGVGGGAGASARGGNSAAPQIRSSHLTKVYRVSAEERRSGPRNRFGEQQELSKICSDIMSRTGTDIQLTSSKDGSLSFLISGKEDATNQARRLLSSEFQAQIVQQLNIPKEHHRIILGKAGKKLHDLEQATCTKIQIPKQDDQSESIRITGTREAIDKAIHEIQLISDHAFSRHTERIDVPKVFHPFIFGPFGRVLDAINKETGAKVNVPPQSVMKDEISITGERNAVLRAKERVLEIYEEKKSTTQTVAVEVKKPQHKYIVGPKGHTLNEIFELTGVSVEMPSPDSTLETIILRGEVGKLVDALPILYQKANSEMENELDVPGWVQRHILGPKGSKFQEMRLEFPKVNVSFEFESNKVRMSGPVEEVRTAFTILKARSDEILAKFAVEELPIKDQKFIKSLIMGKNGVSLKQIREETKATIVIIGDNYEGNKEQEQRRRPPRDNGPSALTGAAQYIRIEGTREAVAKAQAELGILLRKLESEVQFEMTIERRFYGEIIGAKGTNIRDIRNKFNNVQITFPEQNDTSEKVVIRGEKKDAKECFDYLSKLNKELLANNYRLEVPIFKQLIQFLQGKDSIKNIREETGTRIDLPANEGPDVITITGPKDKVEKARDRIQTLQSSLGDMSSVDILIPCKIHNKMLGAKGRNIKQIMSECGGVLVNFPPEGSGSDKVNIRGPKECVAKAKQLLLAMSDDYQVNSYSEELRVRVEHHSYLIGKNGSKIHQLREQHGVRIYFASENPNSASGKSNDQDLVTITGKKENVQKARVILEERIKELDKTIESEIRIDPKYHHLFVARRAAVCKQLYDDYGGVNVSFPSVADKGNDRIVLKGSKECVEAVKKRIGEIIDNFDAQVTEEVEIAAVHHRTLLGPRGRLNAIQQEFDVKIKFPAKPSQKPQQSAENNNAGDEPKSEEMVLDAEAVKAANTVTITGRKENCEKAREALLALVPITITVDIPYEFHRFVIGQKGSGVRDLMDRCNVNIRVPPPAEKSDAIQVSGTAECVEKAKNELESKLVDFEAEKADREARNFSLSFTVDPKYHRKIIGKGGAVIMKIRQKYDVQIQVPESKGGSVPENVDQVTVIGYEKNANEAKEAILKIVKELEDLVTEEIEVNHRIHSRLIGSRGRNIRQVMDQYKVDIRFPRGQDNPDLVLITGLPDAVAQAKEHLLETVDNFLDDIEVQYQPPQDHGFHINFEELSANAVVKESSSGGGGGGGGKGFSVRGGPWEKKAKGGGGASGGNAAGGNPGLDTSSAQDFPAFGGGPGSVSSPTINGGNAGGVDGSTDANSGESPSVLLNGGSAWGRKN